LIENHRLQTPSTASQPPASSPSMSSSASWSPTPCAVL
jgi:hypothetical protein